jgi:hypothetical protein
MSRPGSFIEFHDGGRSPSGKTLCYVVRATDGGNLGDVKWFGRWRCYAFFPRGEAVFEQTCLRDIAEFCESETRRHRKERPA